jgi:uncharacterized coiled-coil protein SlyX
MKTKVRNSISGLLVIPPVLACFALLPSVQATPDPASVFANNTADGAGALANPALTGAGNTAFGSKALNKLTTGNNNNAQGNGALQNLTTGGGNVAVGSIAGQKLISGIHNTAVGNTALNAATTGSRNTALGYATLREQTEANDNVAVGWSALFHNSDGTLNVAVGTQALQSNTTGAGNTAVGAGALFTNPEGNQNVAIGTGALFSNTTGTLNIALGWNAGRDLTTGNNNIDIFNVGVAGESNTIRIGTSPLQTATYIAGISGATAASGAAVFVTAAGKLGTVTSSARFKDAIKPMDKASEAIHALKPVTFRYNQELDPERVPQFGLIAEEVAKVNPDLVVRDVKGEIYTVRYEAVNAMLLNEFLKEHRKNEEQQATIAQLKSTDAKQEAIIAQQQKQIEALTAGLQKVNNQLEVSKTAPQMVGNNR